MATVYVTLDVITDDDAEAYDIVDTWLGTTAPDQINSMHIEVQEED